MHFTVLVIGNNVDEQLAPYQDNNVDDIPEKYIEFREDDEFDVDAKTGKCGTWYNPNAKWGWYVMGGRWLGHFKLKKGKRGKLGRCGTGGNRPKYDADQAKKGDIDFEGTRRANRKRAKKHWRLFEIKALLAKDAWPYVDYDVYMDDTRETYIKRMSSIATFAVLKDGQWYERCSKGPFTDVHNAKAYDAWNEEFERLLADISDDTLLTVLDCHI